jgi:ATP-dependent DNA helicase RecQ
MVDRLLGAELLRSRQLGHGGKVIELTPAGRAALKDPARLQPLLSRPPAPPRASGQPAPDDDDAGPLDEALFQRLRAWRRETAEAAGVPAYVVAHDALLRRIATVRPQDEAALRGLKGMGPKRLSQYGAAILALVKSEGTDT